MTASDQATAAGPADTADDAFRSVHDRAPAGVWSAPGRVNLIGEHTDYNDGFVLPFALPHRLAAAAAPREDGKLTFATVGSDGRVHTEAPVAVSDLRPGTPDGWSGYPAGVAWVLREAGIGGGAETDGWTVDRGADLVIAGDVPTGAGLSSSAAIECATAMALLGLAGEHDQQAARRAEIARWAQRAENEFVGVPTGSLDQTASMCCVDGHVLFLDCRSGDTEQVPFNATGAGLSVLVIDTQVKHSLGGSEYGDRRAGTEKAARLLGLPALRDVTPDTLDDALDRLPADLVPLVRHIVTENARVLEASRYLRDGRIADIGPVLDASHVSMRDDYRISCPELDLAVDTARTAGALGSRMTGGGFGGSAIALVRENDRHAVEAAVTTAFDTAGYRRPRMFVAVPSAGAGRDR
ncbi:MULTISPECIES: galactokinase [Prauserella salsuginis group]|uniref:Galactokinase n=1 Tax=Prauserella salsuginis TaxID=387889 RepID=A0ABW6G8D1_9PSEU|nr:MULTISPECIES: galactokinase [Prauserella salsuginis group]MCR3721796.1 galactokinase [Prauserella flava]MCR3734487.1 galactokinase [Prauserella salsuginis]